MTVQAVSGTRRAIKELVDGTVRVQIDIDPESRRDFFRLFPDIDARVAIAPLLATAQAQETTASAKGGELAKLAGMWCSDREFQKWIIREFAFEAEALAADLDGSASAAELIRMACGVKSRAELDHKPEAAKLFHDRIRKPWMECRA